MSDYSVTIDGLTELRAAFKRSPAIVEPILQRAIQAANFTFQKHTLKNDPVPWRTGNLLMSFRYIEGRLRGRWLPTASYAMTVAEPHTSASGKVYGGNPYMEKILEASTGDVGKLFESALEKITAELAK